MNVNVMVNACVLVNSATICFAPFIFAIPMPGQKFENKPNFSLQYTVPLFLTTAAPTTTSKPAGKRKNYFVPGKMKDVPPADNNFWTSLNKRLVVMQQNAKSNAARFRAAIKNMLPGKPLVWANDYSDLDATSFNLKKHKIKKPKPYMQTFSS